MRRAAVLVVLCLLALAPPQVSSAGGVSVERYPPRHPRAEHVTTTYPARVIPRREGRSARANETEASSPVQSAVVTPSTPTVDVNVHGFSYNGVFPPDPAGEVGPTQFVHTANTGLGAEVGVYDKATGAHVTTFRMDTLVASGPCHNGLGDGVPLYDQLDDRWILTEIAETQNSLCIYVSDSNDAATSSYTPYRIQFPFFPDYPKWAVWPNALYLGFNESGRNDPIVAIDLAKMILGQSLTSNDVILKNVAPVRGFGFQLLTPVDLDGPVPPAPTTPGIFVRHIDDEINRPASNRDPAHDFIEYFEMSPNFVNGTATVTNGTDVPVASFNSQLCPRRRGICVPQHGTRRRLDTLRQPVMNRPVMRIIGTTQTLVGSFTVNAGNRRAGIRWFELTRTTGNFALADEGTFALAGLQRWVPSIDVNGAGDIALGYSASSARVFPSIRITGRHSADPAGELQDEAVVQTSGGAQTFGGRWGDYTEMSVDPVDDTTFWYTGEYLDHRGLWQTRIASFTLGT